MTQLIDLGKLRFHFAGEWGSTTQYEANDIVKYGGNVYVYTYGLKTSGNLPTDNAYWALMVEGFKFSGVFDSTVEYQVGDGVTHGGKVYVAVIDTLGNTPPNATYWSQFVDGIQWEGTYDNTAAYQKNDLVSYGGGSLYVAKVDTTGNLPSDITYWQKFLEGVSVQSIYNASTVYTENDLVAYGGNVYRAKGDTTGNAPSSPTHWEIFVSGVSNKGAYDAVVAYALNDIVAYGGNLYRAKVDTTGNAPSSTTHWEVFSTGFNPLGTYDAATAYALNDVVGYGGGLYRALADTTGNVPTDTSKWQIFQDGMNARGAWSSASSYYPGDVVSYGGNTFRALLAHASTNFDTDLANGEWIKFNGGVAWRGGWSSAVDYLTDDIVRDSVGTVYIANSTHTSSSDFANDKDVDNRWTLFVAGGSNVLPAIQSGDAAKSLSIAGDGSTLEWASDSSANVLYVASHGQDAAAYGSSIAYPYASIKYACAQVPSNTKATIYVKNGTYDEQLPIVVPANVAIVGDSQRTTIVQPASGNSDDGSTLNNEATMWLLSDGSLLNKMTFKGMTGWTTGSTAEDITTSTAKGVFCALNPSSAIAVKSPYVIECSAIGQNAIGAIVDGSVHSTGNKSMLFHGYTIIADNGVGFWIKDAGKAEIVSCFTYYCYFGYATTGGGFIRALNGNNSYGTWGAVSSGYDTNETYISGTILGQELNFTLVSGAPVEGETVTDDVTGGTATVTNVQLTANKVYVKDVTGTFGVTNGVTFGTSNATGTVSGGGLEDQSGFVLIMDGFDGLPKPGMSLSIAGDSISYVIQSVSGTYTDATSELVIVLAQEKVAASADNAAVHLRKDYSQIRLTGHDFLNIGTGGITTTNYPGTPSQPPAQGNETNETFPGRVYYVSTDQDGNFRVGEYFRIDQATGRATLNASAFDLAGLTSLRLGSIGAQLGETINEFSADATLSGGSNSAVPTEYAVKTYVDTAASGAQSAATTAANAYTDTQLGNVSSTDIPFIASISADETVPSNSMRFSMDTFTVDSGVTYTIPTGSYHFVLNPNGFALFQ
jgi:hypothetical protein